MKFATNVLNVEQSSVRVVTYVYSTPRELRFNQKSFDNLYFLYVFLPIEFYYFYADDSIVVWLLDSLESSCFVKIPTNLNSMDMLLIMATFIPA